MRPQGAYYPESDPETWPLFDDCGPEREVGLGNPYRPGERKKLKVSNGREKIATMPLYSFPPPGSPLEEAILLLAH